MDVSKDLTELVEIDPERVDGVRNPASGFKFLVIKAADEAAKDVDKKGNVDEAPDVSNAEAVLRLLAELIAAEARELGAGNWDEVCDIDMLASAAYTMNCFRRCEASAQIETISKSLESAISGRANELGVPNPMSTEASKETGVTDPEVPTTSTETPETPDAPVEKSIDERIAEAVALAVAKEVETREEAIKGLRAELTALKETPLPGGPKITQAVIAKSTSATANADLVRFERLAKEVDDPELRGYYRERIKELKSSK